jgi:cell division septation protein DedD
MCRRRAVERRNILPPGLVLTILALMGWVSAPAYAKKQDRLPPENLQVRLFEEEPNDVSGKPTQAGAVSSDETPTLPASAVTGSFVAVLAVALKSEEEAQSTFRALQAKFASQLSGRQPIIRRKDLVEKGIFYSVQVGPFASHVDAAALCASLMSAGGACMIQKN